MREHFHHYYPTLAKKKLLYFHDLNTKGRTSLPAHFPGKQTQ